MVTAADLKHSIAKIAALRQQSEELLDQLEFIGYPQETCDELIAVIGEADNAVNRLTSAYLMVV